MYRYVKRIMDIALSLFGLVVGGIPMLIISAIIKKESAGDVFFRQDRVGEARGNI